MPQYQLPPARSPLARFLGMLVLLAAFVVSLFFGFVLFLVVLGTLLMLGLVLYLRIWWLRRKWMGQARSQEPSSPRGGVTLEGEYTRKDRKQR